MPDAPGAIDVELILRGTLVTIICILPIFLMFCLSRLAAPSRKARRAGELIYLSDRRELAHIDASLVEDARRIWQHCVVQVDHATERLNRHALFYGSFASFVLSCSAYLIARPIFEQSLDVDNASQPFLVWCGLAVGSATAVAFTRELGRMLARESSNDSSTPMVAWATRRLGFILTGTILLACLVFATTDLQGIVRNAPGWILAGALMAVLGDRATMTVVDRAARLLGMQPIKRREAEDLLQLDGLAEEDASRLAEEGIDSIHALAFYSTPRLFFSTRYTLQRICDWQDQALLTVQMGDAKARLFREQLHVRGATDAQHLARSVLSSEDDTALQQVTQVLGLASLLQSRLLLQRLAENALVSRLIVYRHIMPAEEQGDNYGE